MMNLTVDIPTCDIRQLEERGISIINIGAGKSLPININNLDCHFLVNLDKNFLKTTVRDLFPHGEGGELDLIGEVDDYYDEWDSCNRTWNRRMRVKMDAQEFLSETSLKFDLITIYRFLEHIPFDQVLYFIYLLSSNVNKDGLVDIIVPNYITLAKMIIKEDPFHDEDFGKNNILVTTELLNEPGDPHASIWTPARIEYFFEYEGRFRLEAINNKYYFDGRTYIRASLRRV